MKLLFAYDGSKSAEVALDDLSRAGLPPEGEARVIAVAEIWMPSPNGTAPPLVEEIKPYLEKIIESRGEKCKSVLTEAETFARHAECRLKNALPGWSVSAEATYGSPAWEILSAAGKFHADLIVVGSHGQSANNHMLLGSIAQKVLTEAKCSVRVARGRIAMDARPVRVVIGFDGSKGAMAALKAVSDRMWRAVSEIRLVAATDPIAPSTLGRFVKPIAHLVNEIHESEHVWFEKLGAVPLEELHTVGLEAGLRIHAGNPKHVLVDDAQRWGADCIFVGANGYGSGLEPFLIGSTAAAVAARAYCSVEITRLRLI